MLMVLICYNKEKHVFYNGFSHKGKLLWRGVLVALNMHKKDCIPHVHYFPALLCYAVDKKTLQHSLMNLELWQVNIPGLLSIIWRTWCKRKNMEAWINTESTKQKAFKATNACPRNKITPLRERPAIYGRSARYLVVMQRVGWFLGKSIIGLCVWKSAPRMPYD